jgi:hypothetical protein
MPFTAAFSALQSIRWAPEFCLPRESGTCPEILTVFAVKYPTRERRGFYAVRRWVLPTRRILIAALVSLSSSHPHSQECHHSSRDFIRISGQISCTHLDMDRWTCYTGKVTPTL